MKTSTLLLLLVVFIFPATSTAQCPKTKSPATESVCLQSEGQCNKCPLKKSCSRQKKKDSRIELFSGRLKVNDMDPGNNNGYIDPLEEFNFDLWLTNISFDVYENVQVELLIDHDSILFQPEGFQSLGSIASGDSAFFQWDAESLSTIIGNYPINPVLQITADNLGSMQSIQFYLDYGCWICTEHTICDYGDGFIDFVLEEIQNIDSDCSDFGYGDFMNMSTTLQAGQTYMLTWKSGFADNYADLYIDFNSDCEMYDSAELLVDNFPIGIYPESTTITIPPDVPAGAKRLRIVACWSMYPDCYGNGGCSYGEIEDYTVYIENDNLLAPDNFSIENETNHTFLSWSAPECENPVYYLLRDGNLITPGGIIETFYSDTLEDVGTYEYCLYYEYGGQNSFTTCDTIVILPPPPESITITNNPENVVLNWETAEFPVALNFEIYRNGTFISTVQSHQFIDDNLNPDVYEYTIRSERSTYFSAMSAPIMAYPGVESFTLPFAENFDEMVKPEFWYTKNIVDGDTIMFHGAQLLGANFDTSYARFHQVSHIGYGSSLILPPLNCSDKNNIHLSFSQKLFDQFCGLILAYSYDGGAWNDYVVFMQPNLFREIGHREVIDISPVADGHDFVLLKFTFEKEDYSPWDLVCAIDNLMISEGIPEKIEMPSALNANNVSGQTMLSWCPAPEATSYNLYDYNSLIEANIPATNYSLNFPQTTEELGLQVTANTPQGESGAAYLNAIRYYNSNGVIFDTLKYNLINCERFYDSIVFSSSYSSYENCIFCRNASCNTLPESPPFLDTTEYCTPQSAIYDLFAIGKFRVANMENSSGYHVSGYSYFPEKIIHLNAGKTFPMELEIGNNTPRFLKIWFDLNQDQEFDESELIYAKRIPHVFRTLTDNLVIPETALPGYSRIRVRLTDNAGTGPCSSGGIGETEDYPVYISEIPNAWSWIDPDTNLLVDTNGRSVYFYHVDVRNMPEGSYFSNIYFLDYHNVIGIIPVQLNIEEAMPPQDLTAVISTSGMVELNWYPPANILPVGYHVYRNDSLLTDSLITTTSFAEALPPPGNYHYFVTADFGTCESPASNIAEVMIPLGINETQSGEFKIEPNPARSKLSIVSPGTLAEYSVDFIKITGGKQQTVSTTQKTLEVDVSGWAKGVYIVMIRFDDNTKAYKLLIE